MLLSEMKADKAADIIIEIVPLIDTVATDKRYLALLQKARGGGKGKTKSTKISNFNPMEIITFMLKEHREVTWEILGVLNDKTKEDIKEQQFGEISRQMSGMFNDPEVLSFFTPYRLLAQETSSDILQK